MHPLAQRYVPNTHQNPITAAAYDYYSQTKATADAAGNVVVYRGHPPRPFHQFAMGAQVTGAMAIAQGGERLAVGDDNGSIQVVHLNTTTPIFEEKREGARGMVRAFRAIALSPSGNLLAALSKDNILRVWNLQTGERQNFRGFTGVSLEFDMRGERLLLVGEDGQPKLFNITRHEILPFQKPFTPIQHVCFSRDFQHVFAAGPGGFVVYQTATLQTINGQAAQKMSGLVAIASHPTENSIALFSKRSAYCIKVPSLEIFDQLAHGAPNPENAGLWTLEGVEIGGSDGIMHSRKGESAIPATTGVYSIGDYRLLIHNTQIVIFTEAGRIIHQNLQHPITQAKIARNGQILIVGFVNQPIQAFQVQATGLKKILDGPADTANPKSIWASPMCIAVEKPNGGCYWWPLQTAQGMQIPWAHDICLTEGGKWMGVITPQGRIQIIDTRTGKKALVDPKPTSQAQIVKIAFMGKSSNLLALDQDGYLIRYDLSQGMMDGADGIDVLQINSDVHQLVGLHGGEIAVLLLAETETHGQLLYLPITNLDGANLLENIPLQSSINPKNGHICQPTISAAALEEQMVHQQQVLDTPVNAVVYRSLPNGEWIVFNEHTTLAMSANVYDQL